MNFRSTNMKYVSALRISYNSKRQCKQLPNKNFIQLEELRKNMYIGRRTCERKKNLPSTKDKINHM